MILGRKARSIQEVVRHFQELDKGDQRKVLDAMSVIRAAHAHPIEKHDADIDPENLSTKPAPTATQ